MPSPLSRHQKRELSQLAARAFALQVLRARKRGESVDTTVAAQEQWRHDEVAKACGKFGLRCCSQDDYLSVKAHFLDLVGQPDLAFNAHVKSMSEPKRQAFAVLMRSLNEFGLMRGYAEAICRNQFKCPLDSASEKQLWCLVYTIRNRGTKRGRDGAPRRPSKCNVSNN
jgi:hypothetical protein